MADDRMLIETYRRLRETLGARDDAPLPAPQCVRDATAALPQPGDADFLAPRGAAATLDHLLRAVVPALTGQNRSGRYYGFVTGSCLPVAEAADNMVSALDQNVAVHLPAESVATAVEDAALRMLVALLALGPAEAWPGRTFTTGATASNVLGLALGREVVVSERLRRRDPRGVAGSVGELGLLVACQEAGVGRIQVLTSMGHSSLSKAASIVGLGRAAVKELPLSEAEPWRLDIDAVECELLVDGVASIVVVSAGEVNTGRFAVSGADMSRLRSLADAHASYIHVDGAFGIFARALPETADFSCLHDCVEGLELADSITMDGHKLLNVPYDTGIFLSRSHVTQTQVFQNPNAAYLAGGGEPEIPSPLNLGLENSRRFRALPVYATLLSEGRSGLADMFVRMVKMAREVWAFLQASEAYRVLPNDDGGVEAVFNIVLFRAEDDELNETLVEKIKATRKMYVSGTTWKGQKACRIAVSSWRVVVAEDLRVVKEVLARIAETGR